MLSVDQVGEDALGHGAAADVTVADEKHFNHSFISPSFAPECPVLQGVMGVMVKCSEITDCGKTEQN